MAEYWKSQGRKFCEICKCWFADNKLSIEHHERGLKHKGMVQQRLREVSKKAQEDDRERQKLNATLMQMEQAAIAAMGGKRNAGSAGSSSFSAGTSITPTVGPRFESGGGSGPGLAPKPTPKLSAYEEAKAKTRAEKERIKELKRQSKKSAFYRDGGDASEAGETTEELHPAQNVWVKATDEAGNTYFFNAYTGVTTWEQPEAFYSLEEYTALYNQYFPSATTPHQQDVLADALAPPPPPQEPAPEPPSFKKMKIKRRRHSPELDEQIPEEFARPLVKVEVTEEVVKQEPVEPPPAPAPEETISRPSAGGLLGPWVRVVREEPKKVEEKPKIELDDLPEEANQVREQAPTFDELEADELTFGERRAPVSTAAKKATKAPLFKKRKAPGNLSVRKREE